MQGLVVGLWEAGASCSRSLLRRVTTAPKSQDIVSRSGRSRWVSFLASVVSVVSWILLGRDRWAWGPCLSFLSYGGFVDFYGDGVR